MVIRFNAMHTNQAAATYAPNRVQRVRIASPTIISITPTARMRVSGATGTTRKARGLRYIVHLVRRLKNLSRPAKKGAAPRAILKGPPTRIQSLIHWFLLLLKLWSHRNRLWLQPYGYKIHCNRKRALRLYDEG
jgi:hypothetical protein